MSSLNPRREHKGSGMKCNGGNGGSAFCGGLLGTFKMGGEIAGRRSTIRQKIAEHEAASQPVSVA